MNYVKLNTNGVCKENNIADYGGTFCGSQGKWLDDFAKCVGERNAFLVEV